MPNIREIWELLPHRYPFLLVDKVLELEPGKRAVGLKNVTMNEGFFAGHFPDLPVMPGVLVMESLAQMGGIAVLSTPENRGKVGYLASVEKMRLRRPVYPGDQLILEVEVTMTRGSIAYVRGSACVGDEVAAEGQVVLVLRSREAMLQDVQKHS